MPGGCRLTASTPNQRNNDQDDNGSNNREDEHSLSCGISGSEAVNQPDHVAHRVTPP